MEPEGDVKATDGCIKQGEIDALTQQNLAGEGEADARATPFGGKEGNEDLPAQRGGNGLSIVADEESLSPAKIKGVRPRLLGVLDQVDQGLPEQ